MEDKDLIQIRKELDKLHDRTTNNKVDITSHEAVCEERYKHISECLERLTTTSKEMQSSIDELKDLASQGKTSLRTVLWVGGFVSAIVAFIIMVADYIK